MSGRRMPRQKPGLSVQSVGTPWDFIVAAQQMLGIHRFNWDLAASAGNAKVEIVPLEEAARGFKMDRRYFHTGDDGLSQPWHRLNEYNLFHSTPWNWLNPEFGQISAWAAKSCEEAELGAYTAMLVPSSTGANWWADYVHSHAYVMALRSRIQFVGSPDPYPKDLALCLYTPQFFTGMSLWDWKADLNEARTERYLQAEIATVDDNEVML